MYDISWRELANFYRKSVKLNRMSNYVQILNNTVNVNCKIVRLRLVTKAHKHAKMLGFL